MRLQSFMLFPANLRSNGGKQVPGMRTYEMFQNLNVGEMDKIVVEVSHLTQWTRIATLPSRMELIP